MRLYRLLEGSARAALDLQRDDGSMPPGHNGLYHDPETPARNTAHWLITFLKAYEISAERPYLGAAKRAVSYLCSDNARPMNASFWHRSNPKKDACNGLIGQAWTIEALVAAGRQLEMVEPLQLAEAVFLLHPFDGEMALWQRVGVDGMHLPFDLAFNHQLWFAAAGGLLAPYAKNEVGARTQRFLDRLEAHLRLYPSGLIQHELVLGGSWKKRVKNILQRPGAQARRQLAYKAVGYHAFNLYAFALLKQQYPEHAFWQGERFAAAWRYAQTDAYRQQLKDNKYGYPYNPAGFEMAFALEVFSKDEQAQQTWVSEQLRRHFDANAQLMSQHTEDPPTHAARLYEATRLPDLELTL